MLVGPSKYLKQIIQIEHNRVKNPNWPKANQLALYKIGRGFELVTTVNKSSQRSERDLNSGPPNCKSSALTTRPRCLLVTEKSCAASTSKVERHISDRFCATLWCSVNRSKDRSGREYVGPRNGI